MIMNKSEERQWKKNMVALIDTNVILNYITDREDKFRESSKMVMELCSQGKADSLITCNLKDFKKAKTTVYSPDEFVALLKLF